MIDAAILVSALVGKSAGALLEIATVHRLVTTDRAVTEVSRRVSLGLGRPDLLPTLGELLSDIDVIETEEIALSAASIALRDAPQSRNGAANDAHILALAWELDADIWTHDRDFAGTGVATWSTTNLIRVLSHLGTET